MPCVFFYIIILIIKLLAIPDSAEQRKHSRDDQHILKADECSDHTADDSRQNHTLAHRPLGERLLFFWIFFIFFVPHTTPLLI